MTPSIHHIVILPKLQEIRKLLDGWCRIAHGTILLHYLFICCLVGFQSTFLHQMDTRSGSQKSVFFSTKPVPDGIIVLIALPVLSLGLQDLLEHCQEISLDFNTFSIRKT